LNLDELLTTMVNQVQRNFGYYHVHIYLLDDKNENLVVIEGTGNAGAEMKARGHYIALNTPTSLVAQAARNKQIVWVDNVREAPDWLPNPLLPDTQTEMAVPIIIEGKVVGVLDVQGDEVAGLDEADAGLLRSLANQVAVAIQNSRLFAQVETTLSETRAAQERYLSQAWQKSQAVLLTPEHLYTQPGAAALPPTIMAQAKQQALTQPQPAIITLEKDGSSLVAPVTLAGKPIGAFQLHQLGADSQASPWTEEDLALVETILDQVAQTAENLRLFEETRERAGREQTIREITDKLRAAPTLNTLVKVAARELGEQLGVPHLMFELGQKPESSPKPDSRGNGHKQ
jgi:GAF domain-containing protein